MKGKVYLLLAAMAAIASVSASAVTISFTEPEPTPGITTPITVKAAGITGLEQSVPAEGAFQIHNDGQGKMVNTNVAISNTYDGAPQIPPGSVGWVSQGERLYSFIFSAGGNPGKGDPKQNYCVTVSVDGGQLGENCTNKTVYWKPTIADNIPVNKGSTISVSFSYQ